MIQCFQKLSPALVGAGGPRFNHPWSGTVAWGTVQGEFRSPISAPGVIRNWRVKALTALGSGNSRNFVIYHNGSATAMSVTVGNDTTIHEDLVTEITVAAGDSIAVGSTVLSGTPVSTVLSFALEFEGDNAAESTYGGPISPVGSATLFNNIQAMPSTAGSSLGTDDSQTCWPLSGTMTRLDIRLNVAPGGVTSRVFTIMKNAVAQDGGGGTPNTTVTVLGAATTGSSTFSLAIAPGDLLSLRSAVGVATPAATAVTLGTAFTADTDGQFAICASGEDTVNASVATYSTPNTLSWDTTDTNSLEIGNVTTFQITGFTLRLNLADNTRVYQPRVSGADVGPIGTLGGGATTLTGAGDPATITSVDLWTFKTTPGTQARQTIFGLIGEELSADTPGPLTSNPLLRQALIHGGMVQ